MSARAGRAAGRARILDKLPSQRLLDGVAAALTRLVRTDTLASARLEAMAGRTIALTVRNVGISFFIAVEADGLVLAARSAREPDVRVEGRIVDLIAMASAQRNGEAIPAGRVQLQGDLATVQQLQTLLDELAIDWEELLSGYVGDIAAHQIGRVLRGFLAWLAQARTSLERDLGEYLQFEARLLPTAGEIDELASSTMQLAEAVDRLAARIARLQQRRARR